MVAILKVLVIFVQGASDFYAKLPPTNVVACCQVKKKGLSLVLGNRSGHCFAMCFPSVGVIPGLVSDVR
jgi:hypothetical protein